MLSKGSLGAGFRADFEHFFILKLLVCGVPPIESTRSFSCGKLQCSSFIWAKEHENRIAMLSWVRVNLIARSALYVRRVVKIRCTVRPSVRPCVRIIIGFTERHMRGGHMPLNSETLKTRFQKNCSKKGQSWPGPCRFIWSRTSFSPTFCTLLKNKYLTLRASQDKKLFKTGIPDTVVSR